MLLALMRGHTLCSPTVGTFMPLVTPQSPVGNGTCIGRIRRLARTFDIKAPEMAQGFVEQVLQPGCRVEYGAPLVHLLHSEWMPVAVPTETLAGRPHGSLLYAELEGLLHLCPSPGAPHYAPVGCRVRRGDVVAVVEVMKTLAPIHALEDGVVLRWIATDDSPVQPGQALLELAPGPGSDAESQNRRSEKTRP